jgi:Co/Zn/Cd efflux system component
MTIHTSHAPQETVDEAARNKAAHRSTMVSVWVNIVLASAQILIGVFAKSQALVADGVHSLSDLLSDFVVLWPAITAARHRMMTTSMAISVMKTPPRWCWAACCWPSASACCGLPPSSFTTPRPSPLCTASPCGWPWWHSAKELLFRFMLAVAQRVRSSMLVANAWHARSDAASSLVVAIGIIGNLMGYPILDPVAALIVGFIVGKMGWSFAWNSLHDLMDRAADTEETDAIRHTCWPPAAYVRCMTCAPAKWAI